MGTIRCSHSHHIIHSHPAHTQTHTPIRSTHTTTPRQHLLHRYCNPPSRMQLHTIQYSREYYSTPAALTDLSRNASSKFTPVQRPIRKAVDRSRPFSTQSSSRHMSYSSRQTSTWNSLYAQSQLSANPGLYSPTPSAVAAVGCP